MFTVSPEMRAAVRAFEDNAVQEVLETRALPASDELLVRSLERSQVRVQMWADLQAIILADGRRSATDQLVFDWYLHKLKKTMKGAADFAVAEYLKWSGLPRSQMVGSRPVPKAGDGSGWCNYRPPAPYLSEYTADWFGNTLCFDNSSQLADWFSFTQRTPTYEQFVKWGLYRELEALGGEGKDQLATNNDMAQVLPETAAAISEGVGLVSTASALPLARALAPPVSADNQLLNSVFKFASRTNFMEERAILGNATKALEVAKEGYEAAKAAAIAADTRAAAAALESSQEALLLANEAYRLEKAAFQAASKLAAGAKLFGAVTSVVGAIVDVIVTAVTGSIEIANNLEVPVKLDALQTKAASSPDAISLLMNRNYNVALYTTFMKLTTPEAEPDCTGTLTVGDQVRQCANPPGGIPSWDITEPQFLHGYADANDVVQGWSKTPSISVEMPGGAGTMLVRPHGNGWWVLQQRGKDGSVGPERLSMEFDMTDWAGDTFRVSRTKSDKTGRLVFLMAPIGASATKLACAPGPGAGAPPANMAWTSCQRESLEYVAEGGRHAQVLEQSAGTQILDPYVTLTGPLQVYTNSPVAFGASAVDPYGTTMTYDWSYPCLQAGVETTCDSQGPAVVVTFPSTGTHDVTVTVHTAAGGTTTQTQSVVVTQPANVITFAQPADMVYTRDVAHAVPYSTQLISPYATSWLPVTTKVAPGSEGICDVVNDVVTALGVGTCTLVASQSGSPPFPAAADVTRSFTVSPSPYRVDITDGPMQYSDPAPAPAPRILAPIAVDGVTGILTGCDWLDGIKDAAGNVAVPAGQYPLQRCGGLSSALHTVSYNGYLTVTPEDATLTNTTVRAFRPGVAPMTARIVQVDDGTPGDITQAKVDFLLFHSDNTTDVPDVRVWGQSPNALGQVARTLALPEDLWRLVIQTSPGSTFTAPPITGVVDTRAVAPTVTQQPADLIVKIGGTATFTSAATGIAPPTVQWLRSTDGGATFTEVAGATDATLSLPGVPYGSDGYIYKARWTNSAGSVDTQPALLTVRAITPTITTQPQSITVPAGGTATFTAAASGVPAPTVQWVRSTNGGADWEYIPGETSTTLTLPGVTLAQNGWQFRAEFSNDGGTAPTDVATLTVTPPPAAAPIVTTQPEDVTVRRGGTATFTAAATGTPTPTVSWERSDNRGRTWRRVRGATSATLTITRVDGDGNGDLYRARFVNTQGSATTRAARLNVVRQR